MCCGVSGGILGLYLPHVSWNNPKYPQTLFIVPGGNIFLSFLWVSMPALATRIPDSLEMAQVPFMPERCLCPFTMRQTKAGVRAGAPSPSALVGRGLPSAWGGSAGAF